MSEVVLKVGQTKFFSISCKDDTNAHHEHDGSLTVNVSDESILTVTIDGPNISLTALVAGTTSLDIVAHGLTETFSITVEADTVEDVVITRIDLSEIK